MPWMFSSTLIEDDIYSQQSLEANMQKQTIHFSFERSTKRTHRYVEQAEEGQEKVGVIYIKKYVLGDPPSLKLTVTIEERA